NDNKVEQYDYTRDFTITEIDAEKIDKSKFRGNMIDLNTKVSRQTFMKKMNPHPTNPASIQYPANGHLHLHGTIPDDELRCPTTLDENGYPCLIVMKDGGVTGLTFGRVNNIMSFVREEDENGIPQTSKKWAILPYDRISGPFSAQGDAGAVVVDGHGRILGLLAGLEGPMGSSYVTPISVIMKSVKAKYPNASL
ncbi:hypothetical protein GALMADRAFT_32834, partial [Galerina marginata CBS 339.88]